MRVFTAVDIENHSLQEKLKQVRDKVDYGFNPVPREKMHITLQFFQDVNQRQVEEIKEGLEKVNLDSFTVQVEGVGVFPSKKHVRVVWAGLENQEIFQLKKQVSKHQVQEDNSHEFHPHITLARVKDIGRKQKKEFRKKLEEMENQTIGELKVDKVKLFKSIHTGKNTEYKVLEEKQF